MARRRARITWRKCGLWREWKGVRLFVLDGRDEGSERLAACEISVERRQKNRQTSAFVRRGANRALLRASHARHRCGEGGLLWVGCPPSPDSAESSCSGEGWAELGQRRGGRVCKLA